MCRLQGGEPQLLRQGLLQPGGQERARDSRSDQTRDGDLHPLSGHADLRVQKDYYLEAAERDVKFIRWEAPKTASPRWKKPPTKRATRFAGDGARPHPRPTAGRGRRSRGSVGRRGSLGGQPVDVARKFKVAMNPDGFFQEAHVKLRPVDFAADGVFMCGTSHYPKHLTETISPGARRRRPGGHASLARDGHRLRVGLRGRRGLRLVRGVHHSLYVRRHRVP